MSVGGHRPQQAVVPALGRVQAGEDHPKSASAQDSRRPATVESAPELMSGGAVPETQVVEVLRANWSNLLQAAETARGASLRGALKTLRNVVAVGDDVYFAFEHDFAKTMVERPANKATVQELIARVLGRPVRIHCQVGTQVTGITPAAPAGVETRTVVASKASHERVAEDLEDDPVVQHAKQHLGAVPSKLSGVQ
jgi:hypothetical protein